MMVVVSLSLTIRNFAAPASEGRIKRVRPAVTVPSDNSLNVATRTGDCAIALTRGSDRNTSRMRCLRFVRNRCMRASVGMNVQRCQRNVKNYPESTKPGLLTKSGLLEAGFGVTLWLRKRHSNETSVRASRLRGRCGY
jgi:hypothetical protein